MEQKEQKEQQKKKKSNKKIIGLIIAEVVVIVAILAMIGVLILKNSKTKDQNTEAVENQTEQEVTGDLDVASDDVEESQESTETPEPTPTETPTPEPTPEIPFNAYEAETLTWNPDWEYADYSILHTDNVTLYRSLHEGRPVICVNAGHGTSGGNSVRTQCHPDGTPKVTGGSTSEGSTTAAAVSSGTTMLDGTAEAVVTLKLAMIVKEKLLDAGFSVLMIRESEDVQLDNIARTVFANNNADCHIALHYDSSDYDKGFFYIGVPDIASYKSMEPVASHWEQHNALGESILEGMRIAGVKIYSNGNIPMDLTQTSYSTVPSMDVEVGDRGSDYSEATLNKIADGVVEGVKVYFGEPQ